MEPLLVLRLLIYGVITQVSDPEHACGKVGGAQPTSFRRADGITIVCLPISGNATSSFSSTVHQGLTLKLMPSGASGPNAFNLVDNKILKTKVEIIEKEPKVETTTTVPPAEDNTERKKKKSKKKEPEIKEEDEEEEEDEEDDKDKEGKNKRNTELPNNKQSAKKLLPKTVDEPAGVNYSSKEEDEELKKEQEDEEEGKQKNKKIDKSKKNIKEISADKLRQLLDQNIKNNNENNDDDEIEQYILIRRRKKGSKDSNNKSKADVLVPLASTSTTETANVDKKPKAKKKRKKKKKDKKKNDKREIDDVVSTSIEENKSIKHKRHNLDEVDESRKKTTPIPTTPHQIFIINVPITNHNSFNTTLTAPETKTGKKEEDKFDEFLKVFNFVEVGDTNKDKRSAEDESYKERVNKEDDNNKKENKNEKQELKTPKVYDLILNKNEVVEKKSDDELETTTTTTPKPKKRRRKKKKINIDKEMKEMKERNEKSKDIHKEIIEDGGNGEYKLVKITKVMIKHGNNNKKDDDAKVHNSEFHHETGFKTEFEFKRQTDTDNTVSFEDFIKKNIIGEEQKEGGNTETDQLKQKVEQLVKDDNYGGEEGQEPLIEKAKHERQRRRVKSSGRPFYKFFKRIDHIHPWADIRSNRPPLDQ